MKTGIFEVWDFWLVGQFLNTVDFPAWKKHNAVAFTIEGIKIVWATMLLQKMWALCLREGKGKKKFPSTGFEPTIPGFVARCSIYFATESLDKRVIIKVLFMFIVMIYK